MISFTRSYITRANEWPSIIPSEACTTHLYFLWLPIIQLTHSLTSSHTHTHTRLALSITRAIYYPLTRTSILTHSCSLSHARVQLAHSRPSLSLSLSPLINRRHNLERRIYHPRAIRSSYKRPTYIYREQCRGRDKAENTEREGRKRLNLSRARVRGPKPGLDAVYEIRPASHEIFPAKDEEKKNIYKGQSKCVCVVCIGRQRDFPRGLYIYIRVDERVESDARFAASEKHISEISPRRA